MRLNSETVIIGAGMAGVACAARLSDAGWAVEILDKGRSVGGRMATRRRNGDLAWDHGAQYVRAETPEFSAVLSAAVSAEVGAVWAEVPVGQAYVGVPGMNGLVKHLAGNLTIRQEHEVTSVAQQEDGRWQIVGDGGMVTADNVICAIPSPQARRIFSSDWTASLDDVHFQPCWALMIEFKTAPHWPDTSRAPATGVEWISRNAVKPGRPKGECWIVHADAAWSTEHLEMDKDQAATALLEHLDSTLGPLPGIASASAHRWRFAMADTPLGRPFLKDPTGTAFLCGDWCLGPTVEDAFLSGRAAANALLAR